MIIYKIREKSTGLYSTGGSEPAFNKRGKAWNGLGPLKCHLAMLREMKAYAERYPTGRSVVSRSTFMYNDKDHEIVEFVIADPIERANLKFSTMEPKRK